MRTILTTVGTSLLNNAKRDLKGEEVNEHGLANYLRRTDPERASAETNSLSRILQEGDRIIFLHSQTEEGKLCAQALERHYRSRDHDVELREVPDLTYAERRFKMRGLRSLVATMIELIRRERQHGREVLINATGGFKAEIAYATLVGLLFDVPVYYIHEAFRDVIQMPPAPIGWDYSLLADHEEFFEWIASDLRETADVDAWLRGLPEEVREEVRLLLVEEEGYTFLSPAGEAFYEAYKERLQQAEGVPVHLSSKARATYERVGPEIARRFARALNKLRVRELRISQSDRVRNSDCLVFPRGHCGERVFYFEDGEAIYVCELARHSDRSYERLIACGVRREAYRDFQRWEGR
ncbi:hypothetical protein HRbin08_01602 [bacterium HR08]|nr:hypothetical protein HRbin08_01602 [bacterium HR08]